MMRPSTTTTPSNKGTPRDGKVRHGVTLAVWPETSAGGRKSGKVRHGVRLAVWPETSHNNT
eukprot:735231-Heterocapsa_arctica.AAC.1